MKLAIKDYLSKNDNLLKDSLIVFIGSILATFLNYIYQLYVARSLGPSDYGVFGSLFALVYIIIIGTNILNIIAAKYTAEYHAKKDFGKVRTLATQLTLKLFIIGFFLFGGYMLISKPIAEFMKIKEIYLVVLVGVYGYCSVFVPVYDGILAGLQRFAVRSLITTLGSLLKIVFFVMLFFMGFRLEGAFLSIILAQVLITFFFLLPLLPLIKHEKKEIDKQSMLKYAFPAFIGTALPILLINGDIILVKHFMSSAEAGFYSAASMLSKIIFFGAGSLVFAMFPKIANHHTNGIKTNSLLKTSLFYTAIIGVAGVIIYYTAPSFIVRLLYGPEYHIEPLIGLFALAITLFSLSNVLIWYNLAKNRFGFGYYVAAIGIIEFALISFMHSSLTSVIHVLVFSFALLFFCLLGYTRNDLGIRIPYFS